jgi:hypothetical protein
VLHVAQYRRHVLHLEGHGRGGGGRGSAQKGVGQPLPIIASARPSGGWAKQATAADASSRALQTAVIHVNSCSLMPAHLPRPHAGFVHQHTEQLQQLCRQLPVQSQQLSLEV